MRRELAKNHKAVQFRIVQTGLVPTGLALKLGTRQVSLLMIKMSELSTARFR